MSHTVHHGCYTVREAAHYMRISERHLRKIIAGNLIAFYRIGSRIVFSEDHLTDYLATRTVTARVVAIGRTA
jgi:excisionase family DNA binding protein